MKNKRLIQNDISRAYDRPGIIREKLTPSTCTIVYGVKIITPGNGKQFFDPIKRLRKVAANACIVFIIRAIYRFD
jgi:hypothetical protein